MIDTNKACGRKKHFLLSAVRIKITEKLALIGKFSSFQLCDDAIMMFLCYPRQANKLPRIILMMICFPIKLNEYRGGGEADKKCNSDI